MEEMQNQELCILLDSILALLETNNEDKAKEIIRNAIKRIDKGSTSSSTQSDAVISSMVSLLLMILTGKIQDFRRFSAGTHTLPW